MLRNTGTWLRHAAAIIVLLLLWSCRSTKHVPQGQFLLDNVDINIVDQNNDPTKLVTPNSLRNYLRQTENHKVLGGIKFQLAFYNLSGHDSTNWFNKWVQRVGAPPVIYDSTLTSASAHQLQMALSNKGFMKNQVEYIVNKNAPKKKARVTYNVTLNEPYRVSKINYNITNDTLRELITQHENLLPVRINSLFDHNALNSERDIITDMLRDHGYYAFSKEYITFTADTAQNSREVYLTMEIRAPYQNSLFPFYTSHKPFKVRNVIFVTNYDPVTMQDGNYIGADTVTYNNLIIINGEERYLRESVIDECCYITPGEVYNATKVNRTYSALSRLEIVKQVSVNQQVVGELNNDIWLDTYILLTRDKSQSISLSLEGTNSEGDLGFGVEVDYQHHNLLKGSEVLTAKFRTSYESLSGDFNGLINNNYSEYAGEIGIKFPKFKFPLLKKEFKQSIQASTEFSANFSYQERPEYTRIMAGGGLKYIWSEKQNTTRHVFNLLDVNYVYLPKSRTNFLDSITNPLLRYSYEDHLIMRLGYSYYHTNKRPYSPMGNNFQPNFYTVRASAETAGNLLYGISTLTSQHRDEGDSYKVFGIRYSQYVKAEGDYSHTHNFGQRSSLAFHVGAGIAIPYGNSEVIPFEKRFYDGGANGVRGWGVRALGPGSFNSSKSQNYFIYQCGDIRFDINLEYRAKLFWLIELGLFADAGNIWTIKDYPDQPGGVFKFDKFYEQIAAAYGIGIRLDFSYFLLRLDMGMKAHNPASDQEHWPLFHPRFKRDAEWHFSIGYPF
ncbi:MAG: BamA/TamA family outer membrane protein [Muribaculaceae bacterium]|nr:BamA/TamA family outer membrane protein [Muribaculaceae bacterium]